MKLRPRVARPAGVAWNVAKTLLQTSAMWAVFFAALPAAVLAAEERWQDPLGRSAPGAWAALAWAAFAALGAAAIATGVLLAARGSGTPLPFDTAARLVVAGPYRHVRNPMAILSLGQGLAIALAFGSPALAVYVAAGALVWNLAARPWEERDLERRFGADYALYRRRVRCWRVRLRPWDPSRDADEPALSAERTTAPGRAVVVYDGACRFCTAASARVVALTPAGAAERRSFRDPGVLESLPGVSPAACEDALHLVSADGRVWAGAEAVARVLALRPAARPLAALYFVPGIRLAADLAYGWIARRRYRLFGRADACDRACG